MSNNNAAVKSTALWIIKAGLFVVPFIPLYISRILFFPYITGKAFVFRIIVEIVFAAWVFLAVLYEEYRPKKTSLLIALAIFIAVVTLATIFGVNPEKSFWSNFERMEGLVTYFHLFAYFLVLTNVFHKSDWKIFFNLFVVSSIYENTYAFLQRIEKLPAIQGGPDRVDGTIGNPTYLAAYLIFILGFCLLLYLDSNKKWQKYFYGLMSFWILATIYFTGTRGAVLGLIIGVLAFGVLYLILKKSETPGDKLRKKIVFVLLLSSLLIPAGFYLAKDRPFIKKNPTLARLTSISLTERTIASRFTIWEMGWEGFKERPILGWGPENYGIVFSKYFKSELWQQEAWFDRSHNILFDWLINAGILGALSYFGIFAAAIFSLWRHFREKNIFLEQALLIAALLLVYLAQNFFVFDQIATYIGFFSVLAYINSFSVKEPFTTIARPRSDWRVIVVILLAPLVSILYVVNIRPLLSNLSLLGALSAQNVPLAFEKFNKALSYNTLGREEIKEQLIRFSINAGASPELSPEFRDKILRKAIEEAQTGAARNPLDPRAHLFLGTIYQKVGLSDQAIKVFNEAIKLSPQKQQIYFELADVHIQRGDYAKAQDALEKSFKLDPDYHQARLNLVAVYILNGRQKAADDLLTEGFGTTEVSDSTLAAIYSTVKDYRRLAGVWRAFVKNYPDNLEYRKNLSGAYLLAENKIAARETLQQTIKDFPEFKTEGESLIKEIKSSNIE